MISFLFLSALPALAVTVGYYDMSLGQGNEAIQKAPIEAAGHTAMQLFDLSAMDLSNIDVLFVHNPSNSAYGVEYMSRLSSIESAVSNGLVLVIHDNFVTDAQLILPGGLAFLTVRDLSEDIEVLDNTTQVTTGMAGTIDGSNLDNGIRSNHGSVDETSVPAGAVKILTRGDPAELVTFSYVFGGGRVIYSSIPLGTPSINPNFANIYAPNVVEYAAVLSIRAPDLEVTKSNGRSTSVPGESVTYTLDVLNTGNLDAMGATVIDAFPATISGVTWTCVATGTASCTASGSGNLNETVDIPVGDAVTYTATGTISSAATGTLVNTASAFHPDDPFPANSIASDTDTLLPAADLDLSKSGPTSATSGTTVTYTLTLSNNGPSDAVGVILNDPTPSGLTFESADMPCAGGFPCTIASLAAGATEVVTVTFNVPSPYFGPDPIKNLATASSSIPDPVSSNNVANTATAVDRTASADLGLSAAGPPSAAVGSSLTFRLDVTNHGTDDASDVVLSGAAPPGLLFNSATAPCQAGLPCNLSNLGSGVTTRVEITFGIPGSYAGPDPVVYTASVVSATADLGPNSNMDSVSVPLGDDTVDLQVMKTGPAASGLDQDITYQIVVTNGGPAEATGVTLADPTPNGLTFLAATSPCDRAPFPCVLGSLAVGASINVEASYHVPPDYTDSDPVLNQASVSANEPEGYLADNSSQALTSLSDELADVSIIKSGPGSVAAGSDLTYTLLVQNFGPGVADTVSVTENSPGALIFESVTAPCTGGFPCVLGNLELGAAQVIGVTFSVPSNHFSPTPILNDASVLSNNVDPDSTNNMSSVSTEVVFLADLAVTKDNGRTSVSPGLPVSYTITVTNNGPSDAAGVIVTDTFPPELMGVSWTCTPDPGASCNSGTGNLSDVVGLPAGTSISYTADATVTADASGTLSNTASAALPMGLDDPVPSNNNATDVDSIVAPVDLQITKSGPASAVPGTNITYTLVVTNNGPGTALSVELADPTPAGLVFDSATMPCNYGFPCTLPDLANAGMATVMVTYQVPADYAGPIPISNTATISTSVIDTNTDNNSATAVSTVQPMADLAVVKNDGLDNLVPGTAVVYTIQVSNNGPSAVIGATVDDIPPMALLLSPSWTCTPSSEEATCTASGIGPINDTVDLPVGATLTYLLTATVAPDAQTVIINEVTVSVPVGTADPVAGNNTASDSSGLTPFADLVVTKDNGLDEAVPGQDLVYTVVVTNLGPSDVSGVTVTDLFPPQLTGITWNCEAAGGGSCDNASGDGNLNEMVDLPVNASVTFTTSATVLSSATGLLSNTATATLPPSASDPDGLSSATDEDPLVRVADLKLSKVGPATINRGDSLTYTITLTNDGPSDASIMLTDPTPAGLLFGSAEAPCDQGFPCMIDPLGVGPRVAFTVTFLVPMDYDGPDPIVNVIAVSSDAIDPHPQDNKASSATPVERAGIADLEVIKKAPAVSSIGSTVTYVLTAINHGPEDAQGVVLSETFPADFTFVSATAPCGEGFDCTLGTIPVGAEIEVGVTLAIPGGYDGPSIVVNTASITSTTADPDATNNSDNASTTLVDDPIDLVLTKLGPLSVAPGEDLVATLQVTQLGPGKATNVLLDDPTPPGLDFVSASTPCELGFPCFLNTMDPDQVKNITVTFNVPLAYVGPDPILNIATIDANELDANTGNNTARLLTGLDAEAVDMEVMKIGPTTVAAGSKATYTLSVRNLGPGNATDVVLADPAPAGLVFDSATAPCDTGLPCDLGTLAPGSAVAISAAYRLPSNLPTGTMFTNTASVTTNSSDTDPLNDSASVTTTTTVAADLEITKSNGVDDIAPGEEVTYIISVTNLGPSDTAGVTVDDTFPAILSDVSWICVASAGSSCKGAAAGSGDLNNTVDLLANGSVTFTASAIIDPGASGNLSNTASVTSTINDPDLTNNTATDLDTLTPEVDLQITKGSDGGGSVIPGTPITYTITVTNVGPTDALGATVTDVFPAALTNVTWTCVASVGSSCTAAGSTEILDGVDLLVGGTATYTATATVDAALTTNLVNSATVDPPDGFTELNMEDNTATDNATPTPVAELEITKGDGMTEAVPGTQVIYSIMVTNNGPSDVTGAIIDDLFPGAITAIAWTCSGTGTATCTPAGSVTLSDTANIPANESVTYVVTVDIDPAATGTLFNEAMVTNPMGVTDPDNSNNTDTDANTLVPETDLAIAKSVEGLEVVPGGQVLYTITVTNDGPSQATDAQVVDQFPAGLANASWQCQPSSGAACPTLGSGDINATVDIPFGGQVVLTATADVLPIPPGLLTNTATVTAASDLDNSNNSASAEIVVADPIFGDGFESGDTSAWSVVVGEIPAD